MSVRRDPLIERILERTARALGGGGLHPLAILAEVEDACSGMGRDGVIPNQLVVSFHPRDYEAYRPAFPDLRKEIDVLLANMEAARSMTRIGDRMIAFEADATREAGTVGAVARFADTQQQRPPRPANSNPTQRIQRQTGLFIRLGDGSRAPLTHTPFGIGRGVGNDLVLASMAVSRQHARIVQAVEGLVIEDLGSRNGVFVDGVRRDRVPLHGSKRVRLGDIDLWLEGADG